LVFATVRSGTVNERIYRLGAFGLRGLSTVGFLARPLDLLARVWLRHRKLHALLRSLQFDGVIDGGANIGEFAQVVRAALPRVDLLCVEPHPASAKELRRCGFRVAEAALWKKPGRLRLTQPETASTSCTVVPQDELAGPAWEVEAVRLDSLTISGSQLLIKLDLQGAESEALEGMGDLWERCRGLLLEVSIGPGGTYEKIRALLSEHGFEEYSTTNELEVDGRVREADKLWLRTKFWKEWAKPAY
jgi:FkbM family methyltransferase